MDFNANYKQKFSSHLPLFFHENHLNLKDDQFSLEGTLSSSNGTYFLQDLNSSLENNNNANNLNGSSSSSSSTPNLLFSIHQNYLDCNENSPFGYHLPSYEFYDTKPFGTFATNNNSTLVPLMDNFIQSEGNFRHFQTPNHMINPSGIQSYKPFNFCEFLPSKYRASNEDYSCTNPTTHPSLTSNGLSTMSMVRRGGNGRKKKTNNVVKGQWTAEEDRLLNELVERYGVRKWSQIAQMLNGRIGKQCRERWHNHLRPDIKKDVWSKEEDMILIKAHSEIGNKWAEIAKKLPGRTENSIKNHWNATKRRQFSRRKCKSKYPTQSSLLQDYIKSLTLETINAGCRKKPSLSFSNTNNNHPSSLENISSNNTIIKSLNYSSSSPDYDFSDVPDFNFDAQVLEEGSIDSLLDCATNDINDKHQGHQGLYDTIVDDFQFNLMSPMVEVQPQIKRELELMEMINQEGY